MSDERPRLRHGEKEYELLPPDARHAWLDPDAALAPPPAAAPGAPVPVAPHRSTRRTIVVACIAAFVAGIATFAVVRAVRDDDAPRRPRAAPATSAPARTTPSTPSTSSARPGTSSTPSTAARRPPTSPATSTPGASTPPTSPATSTPGASTPRTSAPATSAPTTSRVVLGVTVSDGADGVTIQSIASGSGADAAGLRPGDVFVSVDGAAITTTDDLGRAIGTHAAGDQVKVVVQRDGKEVTVTATLGTVTE